MPALRYSKAALADLRAITIYIADDNPERAVTFVAELRSRAALAAERPRSFPARDDIAPGLRVARHGRYLILFREVDDAVEVVRVLHGARDLPGTLRAFSSQVDSPDDLENAENKR